MTIYNLGSINIDHVYAMERLPKPGETLAATDLTTGLGGKGANQSIAIARAGGQVVHIGAIGPEGGWTRDALRAAGVRTEHVVEVATPTGHAMITGRFNPPRYPVEAGSTASMASTAPSKT